MTPLMLQDAICKELEKLFADSSYKVRTETVEDEPVFKPFTIYKQHLPVPKSDDDEDPIPYIIVRINSGEDPGGRTSSNTVRVVIVIGTWDDDLSAQGHVGVMNAIHDIYERFSKNPMVGAVGYFDGDFEWVMQEDDYFPYFFGACSLTFRIAAIRREDPFT